MIAIIGAMPEEIAELLTLLKNKQVLEHSPFTLYKGFLEGHQVLIAQCGIGKVNAAALTQLVLMQGAEQVIVTGVAGALDPNLQVGDIAISKDAVQHDVDVTALGYKLGEVPQEGMIFAADEKLQQLAFSATEVFVGVRGFIGRIASGDQFISSNEKVQWLRNNFKASCTEMEGASIAQICAKWRVPFVIIRSISDTADHNANINFREFTPLAASRAKRIVQLMLQKHEL